MSKSSDRLSALSPSSSSTGTMANDCGSSICIPVFYPLLSSMTAIQQRISAAAWPFSPSSLMVTALNDDDGLSVIDVFLFLSFLNGAEHCW